jgi:hypothetical protein
MLAFKILFDYLKLLRKPIFHEFFGFESPKSTETCL